MKDTHAEEKNFLTLEIGVLLQTTDESSHNNQTFPFEIRNKCATRYLLQATTCKLQGNGLSVISYHVMKRRRLKKAISLQQPNQLRPIEYV